MLAQFVYDIDIVKLLVLPWFGSLLNNLLLYSRRVKCPFDPPQKCFLEAYSTRCPQNVSKSSKPQDII